MPCGQKLYFSNYVSSSNLRTHLAAKHRSVLGVEEALGMGADAQQETRDAMLVAKSESRQIPSHMRIDACELVEGRCEHGSSGLTDRRLL